MAAILPEAAKMGALAQRRPMAAAVQPMPKAAKAAPRPTPLRRPARVGQQTPLPPAAVHRLAVEPVETVPWRAMEALPTPLPMAREAWPVRRVVKRDPALAGTPAPQTPEGPVPVRRHPEFTTLKSACWRFSIKSTNGDQTRCSSVAYLHLMSAHRQLPGAWTRVPWGRP